MAIRAYDEEYLECAQRVMGDMMDFALVTLGIEAGLFADIFISSWVSVQLASGNPAYVAGKNGCEVARIVLEESGLEWEDQEDVMYLDKSPEYWAGWILALYQWHSGLPYDRILGIIPLENIIDMYEPYHEMDPAQFIEAADEQIVKSSSVTRLAFYRTRLGLSQSELALRSGVPLRQIQLFEQGQRSINKTQSETLLKLGKALQCSMEDLMEYQPAELYSG